MAQLERFSASRCLLMGVVNATTDSFSDAGRYPDLQSRVALAEQLIADGADIIDIGGQSAVTGVPETLDTIEAAAVVPIVEALAARHPDVPISIDTYKPLVARLALDAGAAIINDTSGLLDPTLASVVADAGAGLVVMHNRSRPKERLTDANLYDDVVADIMSFLRERIEQAVSLGVRPESIIVDPGPDFSKTPKQTVTVLQALDTVRELGRPILLALSRKDFIGAITSQPPTERLAGSLAALAFCGTGPGLIYRVHDVRATADYLAVTRALRGDDDLADDLALAPTLRRVARPGT